MYKSREERVIFNRLCDFSYQKVSYKITNSPPEQSSCHCQQADLFVVPLGLGCSRVMICVLHIILTLSVGIPYQVHATLPSGNYRDKVMEEISKQLLLSDGKEVGDCDAILVSSPGEIDSQHCSSAFNCVTVRAYFSLKGCLIFSSGTRFTQPFRRKQALDITFA